MTEIDVVEVDLEDLILRHSRIEEDGENDLDEFAFPGPLLRQKARLHDLLIDRAPTLCDSAGAQIGEQRACHSDRIDAKVVVKTDILCGNERFRHIVGQGGQRDRRRDPPVDAVKRSDLVRGCGGTNHGGLPPCVIHELVRQAAIEHEDVDGQRLACGKENHRNDNGPLRA